MDAKRIRTKKVMTFILTLIVFLSTILHPVMEVLAGPAAGSSGSISAVGSKTNLAGGIHDLQNIMFRIGISRDPAFKHTEEADKLATINKFSHRYPKNTESFYIKSQGYRAIDDNYVMARYDAGSRAIFEYNDPENKSLLLTMQFSDGNRPANNIKVDLTKYTFSGGEGKDLYSSLSNGKWKQVANKYTATDGNRVWSYILHKTGTSYNVTERINDFVAIDLKNKPLENLTNDEKEEVARGYLGLLMYTWLLAPTVVKQDFENAIEDFLVMNGWDGSAPQTIVIDTATVVLFGNAIHGKKMIIPSIDYFQYYTAVRQKFDLQNRGVGTTLLDGSHTEGSYDLLKLAVQHSMTEDGKSVGRTSDMYDENNVFSHGASGVVRPQHRFTTSGDNPRWGHSNVQEAIMDTLVLGSGDYGRVIGFNYVGYQPVLNPPIEYSEAEDAKATLKFHTEKKLVIVPSDREVIGEPVGLNVLHDPTKKEHINSWKNVLAKGDYQTISVMITWDRHVTDPEKGTSNVATNPPNYDRGHISGFKVSKAWFLSWLEGQEKFFILDTSTVSEPIAPDQSKLYEYKPTVTFTYLNQGKETEYVAEALPDTTLFKRQPAPPDPILYTSEPTAYAELKHGEPDREQFEAMAGVPSNKRLYLGVGGSEFIVDIELEYKENVESVWRTYRSIFTGTPSEFKEGDTAPNMSLGGQSANMHGGGTYTRTWTGSIPNNGSPATGLHTATSVAVPDRSAYEAAKAEAQAFVSEVNGTTLTHTSASDKKTRTQTGWNASITTDAPVDPTDNTVSVACSYRPATENDPGVPCGNEMATANPNPAGSFTITVTWTVPAHILCGPECTNDMPSVEDTWKQKIMFDYMKISKVEVYKIDSGRITRVDNIFGQGNSELKASIKRGDPNIFENIAQKNANGDDISAQSSRHGRIRYSLETLQHDTVVFHEGVRSNKSDGMGRNGSPYAPQGGGHNNSWATGILYNNTGYTEVKDHHLSKGGSKTGYTNQADTKDVATKSLIRSVTL